MICTYTLIKLIALFLEMLPVKREISHSSHPFKTIWNPFWGALKRFSCLRRERGHLDTIIYKYYTYFWFPLHLLAWSPGPLRYTESIVGLTPASVVSSSKDSGIKRAQTTYSFKRHIWFSSVQFSLVTQSCLTLCDSMDCSTPGLPVHHQFPEFTQTHVHWVSDAIQPSPPVIPFSSSLQSFPALGSFQLSQLFATGGQSIGVSASTSVLPMNTQD